MANKGESSSAPPNSSEDDKPVVVRVKRKVSQSLLDAFWLEINERPLKRPLLDFENLSISESSGKEQFKTKKVLVQHVETISSYEATIDVVQSFVVLSNFGVEHAAYIAFGALASNSPVASDGKTKDEERRDSFKGNQRQDQLLSKARHEHEVLAKYARFEQIWRSRRGKKEAMHDKALDEMCRVYDVVRVDVEERSHKTQQEDISSEDHRLLSSYLPLLREFIPSAASEIESDLHASISKQDDYVYDLYTVNDAMDIIHQDGLNPFPLVQVDDEDFYDGPDDSDFETDDSNAEDNPLNDYPDEISEEEVVAKMKRKRKRKEKGKGKRN
ncbi:RNA-directed DNA methylation 4 [Morella rubra]|uniref:RNA-directed DNA methylation 4 n=1 Tax=Morella rubra TaxID=262757 RepID=A0A6A1WK82_9ROSI|nr:RNA-directed DNA methylation 4 [Morella rubra]